MILALSTNRTSRALLVSVSNERSSFPSAILHLSVSMWKKPMGWTISWPAVSLHLGQTAIVTLQTAMQWGSRQVGDNR